MTTPIPTPVLAVLVAIVWLAALSSWKLRNWRAIAFLAIFTALETAGGLLSMPWSLVVEGSVWGAAVLFIGLGSHWLVVDRDRVQFVEEYVRLMHRIASLRKRASTTDPAAYVTEFERVVSELAALSTPGPEWTALRDDAVRELEVRAVVMKLGVEPSPEALAQASSRWSALEERFNLLLHGLRRSWLFLRTTTYR